jgi:hypothetical protein
MSRSSEILQRAETLAARLRRLVPPVKRSIFLDLVEGAATDRQALLHRLALATAGSGGHLGRTGSYPQQLQDTAEVLQDELRGNEDLDPDETASWLGWTARLLYVAEATGTGRHSDKAPHEASRSGRSGGRKQGRGGRAILAGDDIPSDRTAVSPGKIGFSGKALADLADLKRRLEGNEEDETN